MKLGKANENVIVHYNGIGDDVDKVFTYQCAKCGMELEEKFDYCPYCGCYVGLCKDLSETDRDIDEAGGLK